MTDIIGIIKSKKKKIKVLEAGCGYGIAMLDLIKIFDSKIDIYGFNLKPKDGNLEIMKRQAIKKMIFTRKELEKVKLPKIYYCDASKKLPFGNNTFDLIYSLSSVYLYEDKVHFLKEVNRILKKDGIAVLNPSFVKLTPRILALSNKVGYPPHYSVYYELWDRGKEIPFWNYIKNFKGVKVVWKKRGKKDGDKPQYVEIRKTDKLDFGLKLVTAINYNLIWKNRSGIKSIYTTIRE